MRKPKLWSAHTGLKAASSRLVLAEHQWLTAALPKPLPNAELAGLRETCRAATCDTWSRAIIFKKLFLNRFLPSKAIKPHS